MRNVGKMLGMVSMSEVQVYDEPLSGKDYRIQFRVKNGPLLRAMRMRGYKTLAVFARACGFSVQAVYFYVALKRAPINKNGQWVKSALRMAEVLRLPPDSLFPEQHLEQALKHSSGEFDVSREELLLFLLPPQLDPEQSLIDNQERERLVQSLERSLNELPERTRQVIRMRFGLDNEPVQTLEEVGDKLDVRKESVRQIEMQALRKIKRGMRERKCEGGRFDEV